ncbi:MAG: RidA family protein [Candidatus Paceibacterota bacterium]|jgi:reactive intermediate/imine deaminase
MPKTLLNPPGFPGATSAFSHGVKIDLNDAEIIFVTGQVAIDEQGNVLFADSIAKQTEFVFENIKKILAEGGALLDDIVKVTIYLTHLHAATFAEVAAVRNRYLANAKAASTLVGVAKLAKDACHVEIDAIAVKKKII